MYLCDKKYKFLFNRTTHNSIIISLRVEVSLFVLSPKIEDRNAVEVVKIFANSDMTGRV
jgi:hypothetical protein